jgi:hypothetical protein
MMHPISRDISRRQLLDQAGMAAASVIAIGLGAPSQAAAPAEAPAPLSSSLKPERRARVAQHWEDVLLLDAFRYLGLTRAQIQAMPPLAKAADEVLAKLWEREEKKLAILDPIVQQNREALLSGKSAEHESEAYLQWRFLQQGREEVEEEVIQYVSPRLTRLLTRPQVRRAYLLARGSALPAEVRCAALLDPRSGFLADDTTKRRWRDAFVNQELAKLYPPQVLNIDPASLERRRSFDANGEEVLDNLTPEEQAAGQAQTKKLMLETDWLARWQDPSGRALAAGTEEDQVWALYHFVRRTFLSPRFSPVLTELVGHAT